MAKRLPPRKRSRPTRRQVTRRNLSANALKDLASALSGETGEQFFATLTRYLVDTLKVDYAFVGEFVGPDYDSVRLLSVYAHGEPAPNFEYALADTPCAHVYSRGVCTVPTQVQKKYPRDRLLIDMNVDAYAGVILRRGNEYPLGLLAVLHSEPFDNPESVTSLLSVFAARAAAELDRQHVLAALRESESRFRRLVDSNLIGVLFWTRDGGIVDANDAFLNLVGYTRDELTRDQIRWTDLTPPDQRERDVEALAELSATGVCQPFEKHYIHKDGHRVPVLLAGATFEGAEDQGVCWVLDLTLRAQAENLLRENEAFLALSQRIGKVGSFDWDLVHDQILWSEEMYRIFGAIPESFEHSFDAVLGLIHPDDVARVRQSVEAMIAGGKSTDYEFRICRSDGEIRHAWGRGEVLRGNSGEVVRVIGTVQDITERRNAEEHVRHSEEQLHKVLEASSATINILRLRDEVIVFVNRSWEEATGWSRDEAIGRRARSLNLWPDEHAREALLARIRQNETLRNLEWQRRTRSGEIRDLLGSIERIQFNGEECALIFTQDITDRRRNEAQMRQLSSAVEQTADVIIITDAEGRIEYVNPAFESVTGHVAGDVVGKSPAFLASGRHDRHFYKHLWTTITSGRVYRNVIINRRKDGTFYYEEKSITPLKDEHGRITHFISTGKDITERMQAQERLQFLAYHDVLTELPNRALMTDRLENAIARAKRMNRRLAVMFLDLDRFKVINDTLGHDYGDGLLQALARRLRNCIREGDTVARVSGDEFAILMEDVATNDDIVHVARKLLEAFVMPFDVFNRELFITTSVGISVFPSDGEDAPTLLKHADTAMYRAKESGRNNYQFYSADMSARAIELLTLETGLRRALEREEFLLQYQPFVDIGSGQILGVEALLRWQHRELGLLYPGDFIHLLEDTGLIVPVGDWVLATACRQVSQWQKERARPLRVSVNLSARQFSAADLVSKVENALQSADMDAESLELEITESMLMEHRDVTQDMLTALGARGVRFAVDDFGTGYSSLSYLKRFAIHTLKVDRAFVRDIATDANDSSIVTTIVSMAHNLKLGVVAEGVEREDQLAFLRACRCDAYQGYHFSRPLNANQFEALLARTAKSA